MKDSGNFVSKVYENVTLAMSTLGLSQNGLQKNKRLKSTVPYEQGQSKGMTVLKAIVPFYTMLNDKRVVIDMQIDEQRNILYVLHNNIKVRDHDQQG